MSAGSLNLLPTFREESSEFIRAKYIEKKFAIKTCTDIRDLHSDVEHAIHNKDVHQLLQAYVEGADFSAPLIDSVSIRLIGAGVERRFLTIIPFLDAELGRDGLAHGHPP